MAGVSPCPWGIPHRTSPAKESTGLENSIELCELREEKPPITLLSGMFQDIHAVDLIEAIVIEREWKIVQVPQHIRLAVRIKIKTSEVLEIRWDSFERQLLFGAIPSPQQQLSVFSRLYNRVHAALDVAQSSRVLVSFFDIASLLSFSLLR